MKAHFSGLALLTLFAIAGCGGDGLGGTATTPRVAVDWSERTRGLESPTSALSVRIVLDPLTSGESDVEITANRGANLSAHTVTYTAAEEADTGIFELTATFYAQPNQTGAVVATTSLDVRLLEDGSLVRIDGSSFGSVGYEGEVNRVEIPTNQTVEVGETIDLNAIALDSDNNLIAVSQGSFKFELVNGDAFVDLEADGTITGEALGTALVRASIDGKTSADTVVIVSNTP